jgi:hypothetical protein
MTFVHTFAVLVDLAVGGGALNADAVLLRSVGGVEGVVLPQGAKKNE